MFDRKTCSRCYGEGKYSYCRSHGTTCFGCNGTGKQLTPRGKRQAAAYRASLSRPVEEVEVGHFIQVWPSTKWKKVLRVEQMSNGLAFWTTQVMHERQLASRGSKVESLKSGAHRRELLAAAEETP